MRGAEGGVFAACATPTYAHTVAAGMWGRHGVTDDLRLELGLDKDYAASRLSWHFDLRGPSQLVQSSCSSSLSCVGAAVDALRSRRCVFALAGASSLQVLQMPGYVADDGGCLLYTSPSPRDRG